MEKGKGHWVWMCSWFENKLQRSDEESVHDIVGISGENAHTDETGLLQYLKATKTGRKTLTRTAKTWMTTTNPGEATGRLWNENKVHGQRMTIWKLKACLNERSRTQQ